MTAIEELLPMLEERGVEYELDEAYAKRYPPEQRVTWSCDIAGGTMTVMARDYCIGKDENGEWEYRIDLEFNEVFTPEQAVAATLGPKVTGETSDGYHTFNELYHHRAVLFSVIVRDHPELAWKSKLHHDGTMYDGMFIVGIETPRGQATYHYDVDPYWDMFDCKELDRAPEWDGHTPSDAIERIGTLGSGKCEGGRVSALSEQSEVARLKAENSKLRELCHDLRKEYAYLRCRPRKVYLQHEARMKAIDERMHEMGIEVKR